MPVCAWPACDIEFPAYRRKAYCGGRCRLRAHRAEVRAGKVALPHQLPPQPDFGARVRTVPIDHPARFCYADPAYPGKAHLYPENEEVDHAVLIEGLVRFFPDGWALSTGSDTLAGVLALCPAGVRGASWHRQFRPYLERPKGWEPVIFCGGRRTDECVPDAITVMVEPGWELPGAKPPGFYRWMFDFLGVDPRDTFVDLFVGSGNGGRAFAALQRETFPRPNPVLSPAQGGNVSPAAPAPDRIE